MPPGAEPALFTRMSTRPRSRAAPLTKRSASSRRVRSAGSASTLRPDSARISAAAASSTLAAARADRDVASLARQRARDALADARAPARDEGDLAAELADPWLTSRRATIPPCIGRASRRGSGDAALARELYHEEADGPPGYRGGAADHEGR